MRACCCERLWCQCGDGLFMEGHASLTPPPCNPLPWPQFAAFISFCGRGIVAALTGLRLMPVSDVLHTVIRHRTEVVLHLTVAPLQHVSHFLGVHARARPCTVALLALQIK